LFVWGARYILGARYLSKNTILVISTKSEASAYKNTMFNTQY